VHVDYTVVVRAGCSQQFQAKYNPSSQLTRDRGDRARYLGMEWDPPFGTWDSCYAWLGVPDLRDNSQDNCAAVAVHAAGQHGQLRSRLNKRAAS
jgi:hypothetical protein